jgi:hypothetical protein
MRNMKNNFFVIALIVIILTIASCGMKQVELVINSSDSSMMLVDGEHYFEKIFLFDKEDNIVIGYILIDDEDNNHHSNFSFLNMDSSFNKLGEQDFHYARLLDSVYVMANVRNKHEPSKSYKFGFWYNHKSSKPTERFYSHIAM